MNTGQPNQRLRVSVVVPTFNRVDRLRRVVDALATQITDSSFEIVVVSDGSTDGTADYLRTLGDVVRWIDQDNAGPSAARNKGVELANGELIVFIDDDVVAGPGLIEAHLRAHRALGDGVVVIGPMLNPVDHRMSPWVDWEQSMLAEQYDAIVSGRIKTTARQFYTGNASVERAHIVAAGGFDESLRRAEDVDLAIRLQDAGIAFSFEPTAESFHYAERSFTSWHRIAYDYGRTNVEFARRIDDERVTRRVKRQFTEYPLPAQRFALIVLDRPWIQALVAKSLRVVAIGAHSVRLHALSRRALSAIYMAQYFQGVADELGGSDELRRRISD